MPLSLLGATAIMYLLGFSLDNLSLMALTIAVGFVVDDAIVVVENIYRHVEDGLSATEAALKGAREIGFTVVSISLSLVAVFIPLLLMGGIVGRLFREFAITVTLAIAVSAIVSLTLDPDAVLALPERRRPMQHGRIYRAIEAMFDAMLERLPAHARRRAAPSGDNARRVLRHDGADCRTVHRDPEGLLSGAGQRPDPRLVGSRTRRLACRR